MSASGQGTNVPSGVYPCSMLSRNDALEPERETSINWPTQPFRANIWQRKKYPETMGQVRFDHHHEGAGKAGKRKRSWHR